MPIIEVSPYITIHKPLEKWSNKDFLIYYSNKLKEITGRELTIPPIAWQGFMARMKGFRKKLGISNQDYKEFVDRVFSELFIGKQYVPAFGSIVSERVYNILKNHKLRQYDDDAFRRLREQLYKDSILFQKHE